MSNTIYPDDLPQDDPFVEPEDVLRPVKLSVHWTGLADQKPVMVVHLNRAMDRWEREAVAQLNGAWLDGGDLVLAGATAGHAQWFVDRTESISHAAAALRSVARGRLEQMQRVADRVTAELESQQQ